jgi:hypothetical protein
MHKLFLVLFFSILLISVYSKPQQINSIEDAANIFGSKGIAPDKKVSIYKPDTSTNQKLKITGYIQTQFEAYQRDLVKPNNPFNTFYIKRARIKFTFEALDGVKFVLQPDFSSITPSLKDAYAELSSPKIRNISLLAGRFRRPNYESENLSNEKEILERPRVLKNIFPDQRDIGIKLEYSNVSLPLKLQVALMNGDLNGTQTKDVDTKKDLMALASYSVVLPNAGINIDFGINFYTGGLKIKSTKYISGYTGNIDSVALGDYIYRNWFSSEMQIYFDFLGGIIIKGEFIKGRHAYDINPSTPASITNPYKLRNILGFYAYFIKSFGIKNQFIARYDYFDPNTKASGDAALNDVYYKTYAFAWEYFRNNIKFALSYEFLKNEINSEVSKELNDNIFRAMIQAKF